VFAFRRALFQLATRLRAVAVVLAASTAAGQDIDRIEPPSWWQGFRQPEVQLLIHGDRAGDFEPSLDYPGVSISRVERVDSPNYLFVYLRLDRGAKPGELPLRFRAGDTVLERRFPLLSKNPDPAHVSGFSPADTVYLITPDRFSNGDTANDTIAGLGDPADRRNPLGRHGGDIRGMQDHLDYVADMGFTMIWPNPLLENAMPNSSYHGYAITDFYRVDPRFGSNESYRAFVAAAKARGIGVIMDMVVNHAGSGHWWMDDLPTSDWINFDGQFVRTNDRRTTWQDPYASDIDRSRFTDGWFAETMPDLNQRNPLLADYLIQNSIWWMEYLGLAGIRMDTYPYPDKDFMAEWSQRIMDEYPQTNIVGEEWSLSPATVSYWQRGKSNHDGYVSSLPSLMDFPVNQTLKKVLLAPEKSWGSSWEPLYELLAHDYLYPDPQSLFVFPDNHDEARVYAQLGGDYDLWQMAIAFCLTMRGIPQVYYGTEILMAGPRERDDGRLRMDFPGGWPGDKVNAFTGKGLRSRQREAQEFVRRLVNWRKDKTVLHTGRLMHYAPDGSVYVYFRYDDADTVMVAFNKDERPVHLDAAHFAERLAGRTSGRDVISGRVLDIGRTIEIPGRSVLVLEVE